MERASFYALVNCQTPFYPSNIFFFALTLSWNISECYLCDVFFVSTTSSEIVLTSITTTFLAYVHKFASLTSFDYISRVSQMVKISKFLRLAIFSHSSSYILFEFPRVISFCFFAAHPFLWANFLLGLSSFVSHTGLSLGDEEATSDMLCCLCELNSRWEMTIDRRWKKWHDQSLIIRCVCCFLSDLWTKSWQWSLYFM